MLYTTIDNSYQLQQLFIKFNRDYFSNEGYDMLFNYLEELSEGTGENIEIDIIGLCTEFSEVSEDELLNDYTEIKEEYEESEEDLETVANLFTTAMKLENGNYLIVNY